MKKYLKLKLEYLKKEHRNMLSCLTHHQANVDKSQILLAESSEYSNLLSSYFQENTTSAQEWANAPYEHNLNYPEMLLHPSASGNVLRSKSEYMIDSALFSAGIAFRYECKLELDDTCFYPDFTILHPKSKQLIYWEHFGMMDNPSYSNKAFNKLKFYTSHDLLLNINLLATFETQSHPLTYEQIERVIHSYLLNWRRHMIHTLCCRTTLKWK